MNPIYSGILKNICATESFTFHIDGKGYMVMNYGQTGKATVSLVPVAEGKRKDKSGKEVCTAYFDAIGAKTFFNAIMGHKNKVSGTIDIMAMPLLSNNTGEEEEKVKAPKDYKKTGKHIYFNISTFTVLSEGFAINGENVVKADLYTSHRLPGVVLCKYKNGKKSQASLINAGHLITAGNTMTKDPVQTLIDNLLKNYTAEQVAEKLAEHAAKVAPAAEPATPEAAPAAKVKAPKVKAAKVPAAEPEAATVPATEPAPVEVEEVPEPAATEPETPTATPYTITRQAIYFNCQTFEEVDADDRNKIGIRRGRLVLVPSMPELEIVKHDDIEGSTLSFLFAGILFEFLEDDCKNDIAAAIAYIEREGLEKVQFMAVNDMPKVLAPAVAEAA